MRILKVIGAIVGVLLLLVAVPVLIGVIGRSAVAIFGLLGLAVAVLLYRWWRNFAQGGRRSRLFGQREVDWQNRGHFFAIAAQLMRRIMLDHARHHLRGKRGGGQISVELGEGLEAPASPVDVVDALDLDRALRRLEQLDPDQGRIVELRFFGGLTIEETAAALGRSPATIKREWAIAKGWLHRELTGAGAADA